MLFRSKNLLKARRIDGIVYVNGKFNASGTMFFGHALSYDPETKKRVYKKRTIESRQKVVNGLPVIIQYNRNLGVIDIVPRISHIYDKYQGRDIRLCADLIVRDTIEAVNS